MTFVLSNNTPVACYPPALDKNHYPRCAGALSYPFSTPRHSSFRWIGAYQLSPTVTTRILLGTLLLVEESS